MKLTFEYTDLRLIHPFTISRSSSQTKPCVIVAIEHDGIIGYGEAAPSERYGENKNSVISFLQKVNLSQFYDPFQIEDILNYVMKISDGNMSAKAAIDIALHDWKGKKLAIPLWKLFAVDKDKILPTSYTIGIDSPEIIEIKIKEAETFPILKVKVGSPNDEEMIKLIRKLTNKIIRVDANEGWKSKEVALDKILFLEKQSVELVEQPLPAKQLDDVVWLRERVNIPLIADESVTCLDDVSRISNLFDGINIKVMKCGGLQPALKMIRAAKKLNMKVMLGCMIESSIGISAAAQLSPLVDYIDLDGNLLISNDPFEGVKVLNGKLILDNKTGIGVQKRERL